MVQLRSLFRVGKHLAAMRTGLLNRAQEIEKRAEAFLHTLNPLVYVSLTGHL
jgi:hypothetical protein